MLCLGGSRLNICCAWPAIWNPTARNVPWTQCLDPELQTCMSSEFVTLCTVTHSATGQTDIRRHRSGRQTAAGNVSENSPHCKRRISAHVTFPRKSACRTVLRHVQPTQYRGCINLFCNVWVSVCGVFLTIVWGVLEICVLVFTVLYCLYRGFILFRLCIFTVFIFMDIYSALLPPSDNSIAVSK